MTSVDDLPAVNETIDAAVRCAQQAAGCKLYDAAMEMTRNALAISPEHPSALALLATLHAQQGDVEQAIATMERAIRRDGSQPVWHANLCAFHRLAARPNDALNAAFTAVRLDANVPQFLVNLALSCIDLDRTEEAIACLLRAISIDGEDAAAHLVLSQVLLARGEMQAGWREYEWRVRVAGQGLGRVPSACWNGMKLPGSRILLIADQGFGDSIQFSRYIPLVAERCGEVFLSCSPELAPILGNLPGVRCCFSSWADIPQHTAHCRLSSLPWIFQTELETIPEAGPYIFAEPGKAADWGRKVQERVGTGRKRIGLAWSGSPKNINDSRRSLRLSQLAALAAAKGDGAVFISLQKPVAEADRAAWEMFRDMPDFSAELTDFGETAGLIANLDLVITVDTSVGHLAAAMGKPTWLLLAKASDWRWLLDRSDSPWYRSVQLFRQMDCGQWDSPICAAAQALRDATGLRDEEPEPIG
jgi:Tfp pilus assembly protein PilF